MDLNKMTESLQNAFVSAQTLAVQHNHQEVDDAHLLLALLEQDANLAATLLTAIGLNLNHYKEELDHILSKKPQVSGSGAEQGKLYITATLQKVLAQAEKEMKQFEDDYLSVEHVLLSLLDIPSSEAGTAL